MVDRSERKRYLIVNADDFGRSAGVHRGIIQAHEHGIVTKPLKLARSATSPAPDLTAPADSR